MVNYSFPLEELEYFLFIFIRISCFIFIAPIFGDKEVPRMLKAGFSFFTAMIVYNVIDEHIYVECDTVIEFASVVLIEAVVGLLIGAGAYLCNMIISFAGQIVDTEMGFSMATLMDPTSMQQLSLTSLVYKYTFTLLFIITGMYRYLVEAICDTFSLIQVGGANINLERVYNGFLSLMGNFIIIGFRIALPVFCTILLLNGIMGIMAKVSPQMNMFAVGLQLKVLTGLGVLFITVALLPNAADFVFSQMKVMIVTFIKAVGGGV